MAEARSRQQWHHTAALLALIANCHRDAKRHRPYTPEDFLPRTPAARQPSTPPITDLSILKTLFVDRPRPESHR
jgi:hypothetical protein